MPGEVVPSSPRHRELVEELEDGATLKEQARDVWRLFTSDGQARKVDARTVFSLLSKGVLKEQP